MMEQLDSWGPYIGTGVLCIGGPMFMVLMLWLQRAINRRADTIWARFAKQAGARFRPAGFLLGPKISGTHRGLDFTISGLYRGAQMLGATEVFVRVPPPRNFKLAIYNRKAILKRPIFFQFSAAEIRAGIEEIDDAYELRSSRAATTKPLLPRLFTPHVQQRLLELANPAPSDHRLRTRQLGGFTFIADGRGFRAYAYWLVDNTPHLNAFANAVFAMAEALGAPD